MKADFQTCWAVGTSLLAVYVAAFVGDQCSQTHVDPLTVAILMGPIDLGPRLPTPIPVAEPFTGPGTEGRRLICFRRGRGVLFAGSLAFPLRQPDTYSAKSASETRIAPRPLPNRCDAISLLSIKA